MKPEIKTRRYVSCPACGEHEFIVEHLFDRPGPYGIGCAWHCDNAECRAGWKFSITADGAVELERDGTGEPPGLGLLKFRDLYLVVDQKYRNLVGDDHADYFYHSHQCPTNILGTVEDVYDARGKDPHGTMRYVASILDTEATRLRLESAGSLRELFELFGTDGQPAPSNWPEANGGVMPWIAEVQRDYEKKGDG
jgi:hypothetical protein